MISTVDLEWKMIRISKELHEELAKNGRYGDSMGDIIKRLLEEYKTKERKK